MQIVVEGEKPAIKACRFQGTDGLYIKFLDDELSSIESDPSYANSRHETIDQVLKKFFARTDSGMVNVNGDKCLKMNGLFDCSLEHIMTLQMVW